MQLYALDENNNPIFANKAIKSRDYTCLECQKRVRARGGLHRRFHFYHLEPNPDCRLSGKTIEHMQVQSYIWRQLQEESCAVEHRFPSINRIADVAWISRKIVFEVQCSPISVEELLQRNRDYHSIGWTVVWIFHDQRYNQWRLTAVEQIVHSMNHYFTNIDKEGKGIIYDQFSLPNKGVRHHRLPSLAIQIHKPCHLSLLSIQQESSPLLKIVERRLQAWPLSFQGDLINLNMTDSQHAYIKTSHEKERLDACSLVVKEGWKALLKRWMRQGIVRPYRIVFRLLLERACK